jgi:hypothetical protein
MVIMSRRDQTLRIVAQLDGLFARDDVSPAGQDRWQELKRHITRMRSSLSLVVMLARRRNCGNVRCDRRC